MRDKIKKIREEYGSLRYYLRPFVTIVLLTLGYFYLTVVFVWIVLKII